MAKNKDLIQILLIIIIGMFIPFFGSIAFSYGFNDFVKILTTFGYFLLIFAFELGIVMLYFSINGRISSKKINKYKPKK